MVFHGKKADFVHFLSLFQKSEPIVAICHPVFARRDKVFGVRQPVAAFVSLIYRNN